MKTTFALTMIGLILQLGFGWEVGRPVYGSHNMTTILQWCCLGAALVGGSVLGRELARSENSFVENISPNDS